VPELLGNELRVRGTAVGDTTIRVTREGESKTLAVRVRRYAGRYRQGPPIEVTGEPAPGRLLRTLARQLADRYVEVEAGARLDVGEARLMVDSLGRGASTVSSVPITVTAPNSIPATFNAQLTFCNRPMLRRPTAYLFYSNNPERVTRYGRLYLGKLDPDTPTRLLYHHQNGMPKRMRLEVSLVNGGESPAKVQVIGGTCDPMVDTIAVGYCAGARFLKDYLSHVGYIAAIPPRSRFVLYSEMLAPRETASGILEFRALEGADLSVKVAADLPESASVRSGQVLPVPETEVASTSFSDHVYPSPIKRLGARYVVGEHWAFIGMGKQPIKGMIGDQQLFGNYGVIYEVNVEIENPTANRQRVSVLFEPLAGIASAVFFIDGKFVEKKAVSPPEEFPLARYDLKPMEKRVVSILTLPLSGSAYPANILVRAS